MGLREFALVFGAIAAVVGVVTAAEVLVIAPTELSHVSEPVGPPLHLSNPNVTYSSAGVSYRFLVTWAYDGALWNETQVVTEPGPLGSVPSGAAVTIFGPAGDVVATFENVSWNVTTTWTTTSESPVMVGQTIVLTVPQAITGGTFGVMWTEPSKGAWSTELP